MKKIAYLFPGQGAQYCGMGKDFVENFSIARETFEEADDVLGYRLSSIIFEGPEETLMQTEHSQLAIFVTSIAILRVIQEQMGEIRPYVCAGLSLGEYTALVASGKISFQEALLLIQKRASFMQKACEQFPGAMSAVLGLSAEEVAKSLEGIPGVWVANYNCPGQVVISGTKEGIALGAQALKAKRILPLAVSGAFHSGLMRSAQDLLAPHILEISLHDTETKLVMNVPGNFAPFEKIRENMISQVTSSVRWEQGILAMQDAGVELYIEIGCGKTLTGMNRKIGVGPTISIEKVEDLDGVLCNC